MAAPFFRSTRRFFSIRFPSTKTPCPEFRSVRYIPQLPLDKAACCLAHSPSFRDFLRFVMSPFSQNKNSEKQLPMINAALKYWGGSSQSPPLRQLDPKSSVADHWRGNVAPPIYHPGSSEVSKKTVERKMKKMNIAVNSWILVYLKKNKRTSRCSIIPH